MFVPITGFYGGLFAIMLVVLTRRVVRRRRSKHIGILSGGDQEMAQAIRVHGNFIEYVPIVLILMALLELNGMPFYVLHALGITMLAGRIAHAMGLSRTVRGGNARIYGMYATAAVLMIGGVLAMSGLFNSWAP